MTTARNATASRIRRGLHHRPPPWRARDRIQRYATLTQCGSRNTFSRRWFVPSLDNPFQPVLGERSFLVYHSLGSHEVPRGEPSTDRTPVHPPGPIQDISPAQSSSAALPTAGGVRCNKKGNWAGAELLYAMLATSALDLANAVDPPRRLAPDADPPDPPATTAISRAQSPAGRSA